MNILAEGEKGSEIQEGAGGNLALRIPGYVREFKIYRNKKQIENPVLQKGYLILENLGDREEITIEFQIKSHFVWANPQVRADEGKVALMRGPLVYCLEETDNGSNLSSLYVDTEAEPEEQYEPELLGGVVSVKLRGKRITMKGWEDGSLYNEAKPVLEDTVLKAVPYCNWGNRRTGEMTVWIKELINH